MVVAGFMCFDHFNFHDFFLSKKPGRLQCKVPHALQCDQVGVFFKRFGDKIAFKSIAIIWQHLRLFYKNCCGFFLATFLPTSSHADGPAYI